MKIFGHRGASALAPENTLVAFRRALADGADGVELDVMPCRSGELIVFHDEELERLCGRPGATRSLDWRELRKVKVLDQERIPLLADVFEDIGRKTVINVELKTHPAPFYRLLDNGLALGVAELVARMRLYDNVIVSSFDPLLLRRFRAVTDRVPTALLLAAESSRPLREGWSLPLVGASAVHPEASLVNPARLRRWQRADLAIRVWTVDDPAELRWLRAAGVEAVITNNPAAAIAALK